MDVIEFLRRTDHRNLIYNINYLVKQKIRERNIELEERRQRLRFLLETETLLYDEELALLLKARVEENEAKRHEWIGLMRLERERVEKELLTFKQMLRDFENSEEVRHMRSREMLMDSKFANLYQIEERKVLREKEAKIERLWLDTMQKFNEQKEHQAYVEQKLRKVIANVEQEKNLIYDADMKKRTKEETAALRAELNEDNTRARNIDKKYRQNEEFYEWRKRLYRQNALERQIFKNAVNACEQQQTELIEANLERQQIQRDILVEIDQAGAQVVKNRAWYKEYLEQMADCKKAEHEKQKEFDEAYIGKGCVLEQQNKRPYGKNVR